MTSALDARPTVELTHRQDTSDRASLADLAELGTADLDRLIRRALPGADSGLVPVAAFNSSI
ncbi:hypothetical protein PUR61_33535 [Streptomyces sp. BE20]|uniref:hypothetical protein n=1 Tax=Streptomycetaceae TaxID=2062 RepID=UPI002E7A02EC|nr:hypothetical protein [Streptomyces sp. BE20]MEE1827074.1 hypothetical protein [Streptomyces sp. BE20]